MNKINNIERNYDVSKQNKGVDVILESKGGSFINIVTLIHIYFVGDGKKMRTKIYL